MALLVKDQGSESSHHMLDTNTHTALTACFYGLVDPKDGIRHP
jgi:hypothetical protein